MPDLLDSETAWFRSWYFRVRLNDAIERAGRKDQLTLLYFRLPLSAWGLTSRLRLYLTIRLGLLETEVSPDAGFFGRMTEDEFAVCISHTDRLDAVATVAALQHVLKGLSAESAIASWPDDAEDGPSLIETARSRLDPALDNLVYLDEFRQRRRRAA